VPTLTLSLSFMDFQSYTESASKIYESKPWSYKSHQLKAKQKSHHQLHQHTSSPFERQFWNTILYQNDGASQWKFNAMYEMAEYAGSACFPPFCVSSFTYPLRLPFCCRRFIFKIIDLITNLNSSVVICSVCEQSRSAQRDGEELDWRPQWKVCLDVSECEKRSC
jgi:hypothetical protein